MDLASLTVVLRAALSPIPEERKAAEQSLNQVKCFLLLLFNRFSLGLVSVDCDPFLLLIVLATVESWTLRYYLCILVFKLFQNLI